jgi:hypothetical protein
MKRFDSKSIRYLNMFGHEEGLISLMLIQKPFSYQTLIEGMDRLVLAVVKTVPDGRETEHWMLEGDRIQVQRVTPDALELWLVDGDHSNVFSWILEAEVLTDPFAFLQSLQNRLMHGSAELRERKLLCEFSGFMRTYLQSEQDLKDGKVLDAHSNILASLHHWAHISLIEEGMHPELTVWEQMRRVNPGIYKLYEELTTSKETVEKRVQLLLLACEFSVLTKMQSSCDLLIRILASRPEPWSVAELITHPLLMGLPIDLSLLLQKLVSRGCIQQSARSVKGSGAAKMELKYISTSINR